MAKKEDSIYDDDLITWIGRATAKVVYIFDGKRVPRGFVTYVGQNPQALLPQWVAYALSESNNEELREIASHLVKYDDMPNQLTETENRKFWQMFYWQSFDEMERIELEKMKKNDHKIKVK